MLINNERISLNCLGSIIHIFYFKFTTMFKPLDLRKILKKNLYYGCFLAVFSVLACSSISSCGGPGNPKKENVIPEKKLKKGDCRTGTVCFPKKSLERNQLIEAGCEECDNLRSWKSSATNTPVFLQWGKEDNSTMVLINQQAAILLAKKGLIQLPTFQSAIELTKKKYLKSDLLAAFRNQESRFINFYGKFFDLAVYSVWINENIVELVARFSRYR